MKKRRRIGSTDQALERLTRLLGELETLVDIVIVEGPRDLEALRLLGFKGEVSLFSQVGVPDADFMDTASREYGSVAILTDFDEEGRKIDLALSEGFERRGLRVEKELRYEMGRIMAALRVYAIESLDNVQDK
ncbi:MAG: toprim domain-containing protein [Candidatus Bathyarchaeota archaeon]|nr:toprim domain-containing protein [Candidatus Bathyarchaeota archaeon]